MLFIIGGASGSGKTSCLPGLRHALPDVDWHDFDEQGVPAPPIPPDWRITTTEAWLRVAIANQEVNKDTAIIGGAVYGDVLACPSYPEIDGVTRKHQLGPLRRGLARYRDFFTDGPSIVAGDLNNNAIWDRPGWRINHTAKVEILEKIGLVCVYHERLGEPHGEETTPTIYWRDHKRDGPTYHIGYIFVPRSWLPSVSDFSVGSFDDRCRSGLSDHVPLMLDIDRQD